MDALEDEWYGVRHSGEIPEVALCSALYYLTHDPDGPGLRLSREQKGMLVQAAEIRYQEIVLRDLQQSTRNTTGYRGIKRSIINWQRYRIFCGRQQIDSGVFKETSYCIIKGGHKLNILLSVGSGVFLFIYLQFAPGCLYRVYSERSGDHTQINHDIADFLSYMLLCLLVGFNTLFRRHPLKNLEKFSTFNRKGHCQIFGSVKLLPVSQCCERADFSLQFF